MPDLYGPFTGQTWLQSGWFRDAWARTRSGVFGTTFGTPGAGDLALTVAGLTATIGLGRAHVRGAGYERTGTAWSYTAPANTAAQARVDRIVLRRDLTAGTVLPTALQGTPAASPAAPALTQVEDGVWDLPLFRFTVPANSGAPLTTIIDDRVPAAPSQHWGTVNGGTLPAAADGALPGDTAHSNGHRCLLIVDGGGTWRQASMAFTDATVGTGGLAGYLSNAATFGVVSWHNGFHVFDTTNDREWVCNGGGAAVTDWQPVAGAPGTAAQTAAAAGGVTGVGAGWSFTAIYVRRISGNMAVLSVSFTRTGAAITVGTDGEIANTTLGVVAARWGPVENVPVHSTATGPVTVGEIWTDGTVRLTARSAGANIATNDVVQLVSPPYVLLDPTGV